MFCGFCNSKAIEKKSYFVFGRHRFKSFFKSLLSTILQHSFIAALVSISTFILFYAITGLFVTAEFDWMTMFGSFLPANFYPNHPLLFVIFMFVTIYFVLAFVFAFISCGIMLWIDNPYYGIFGIVIAYYLYFYVGEYLDFFFNLDFDLFWIGNTVTAYDTWRTTSQVFIPLIPISLFGIGLVCFGIKRHEKNVNA